MEISKSQIEEKVSEAVEELKHAPFVSSGEKIKFYVNPENELWWGRYGLNSFPAEDVQVGIIDFTHPKYPGTEKAMKECDLDPEDEGELRKWEWSNFTEGMDFSVYVEQISCEIQEKIDLINSNRNRRNN